MNDVAKVGHIGGMLRLVWRNSEQQRGSRLKRGQTPDLAKRAFCLHLAFYRFALWITP